MVKKGCLAVLALSFIWSCATITPPPPSFYIEGIPQSISTEMTLDERILAEEAWVSLREGQVSRAQRLLDRLGVGSSVYAMGIGYLHLINGDLAQAEQAFLAALQGLPDLTPAHVGLAQIYQARGEEESLYGEYREILKLEPNHPWAKPRFETHRDVLTRDLYNLAISSLEAGDLEKGKESLLKVLFYDPESLEAHYQLGLIYLAEDDRSAALIHFNAVHSKDPDYQNVTRHLADLYYQQEEYGRSLDMYEKLKERDPEDETVAGRIEGLKDKLGIFELPSQYSGIAAVQTITREDLAALIAVKFKDHISVSGQQPRILVDITTSWAKNFIIQIASLGVMSAYDNHTFQPRNIINRAEMAETLVKLIDYLNRRGSSFVPLIEPRRIQIGDVSENNYYYPSIRQIVAYQIMDLTPQRMFEPERTVSGGEAIRLLDIVFSLAK